MTVLSDRRTARRFSLLPGFLVLLLATLSLLVGPLVGSAHAAQASGLIKVYVVRSAAQNGGVADTLPEIAQRTLGNSSRATDIFQLNDGRRQTDGSALTSPNQTLHPGWILRLPPDASGPFVQFGQDSGGASAGGFSVPVALAVLGGVLVIVLTLLILLRRQAAAAARRIGSATARLGAPLRRRKARQTRQRLAQLWRADGGSRNAARAALVEAGATVSDSTPGPVAADLAVDAVRVRPAPSSLPPAPWRADDAVTWSRPLAPGFSGNGTHALCRPVLVGGVEGVRSFVDLSYCDGALALVGDHRTVTEVLTALVREIGTYHPDLRIAYLGQPLAGTAGQPWQLRHIGELAALISVVPQPLDAPVLAAARRRRIAGVVVLPPGTSHEDCLEATRLCSTLGSTWVAVVTADVPGAHWRWDAHRDGTLHVPLLNRTVVAAL